MHQLIYYPYHFFSYSIQTRKWIKVSGKIGCTIDLISGRGSLIDAPLRWQKKILQPRQKKLQYRIKEQEATKIADKFIFQAASHQLKFFTAPIIKLIECKMFYRPFWIVKQERDGNENTFIVDAVSAHYHPL